MKINNHSLFLLVAGVLLAALLAGCGNGSDSSAPVVTASSGSSDSSGTRTGGTSSVSFANDVLPILNSRCASCHSGPILLAGVDPGSYDSVMNSRVITPGDAQNSPRQYVSGYQRDLSK